MPWVDKEKKRLYDQQWNREFYRKNREAELARVSKRKRELGNWLREYKSKLTCEICPESDPVCLDFHHRDAKTKDFTIATLKQNGWSIDKVLREIKKCMVVCANCHRKLHARRGQVK
jgi:hypothetical protein